MSNGVEPYQTNRLQCKQKQRVLGSDGGGPASLAHHRRDIRLRIFTKQDFANYHLKLKFRWGAKKWVPRLDELKDSGLTVSLAG
jgi:hypothetical protein